MLVPLSVKGVQNGFEQLNSQTTLSVFNVNRRNLDHSSLRSERFCLVHSDVLVQSCDGQQTKTPKSKGFHHSLFASLDGNHRNSLLFIG